jgi:hypothetical protein
MRTFVCPHCLAEVLVDRDRNLVLPRHHEATLVRRWATIDGKREPVEVVP